MGGKIEQYHVSALAERCSGKQHFDAERSELMVNVSALANAVD
jgi:hypothetical protein